VKNKENNELLAARMRVAKARNKYIPDAFDELLLQFQENYGSRELFRFLYDDVCLCHKHMCAILRISPGTIWSRLNMGWAEGCGRYHFRKSQCFQNYQNHMTLHEIKVWLFPKLEQRLGDGRRRRVKYA